MRVASYIEQAASNAAKLSDFRIFGFALGIRWTYCLVLYAAMGQSGLTGVDSSTYLRAAQTFAQNLTGADQVPSWLGPDPIVMPLFTWLLTINVLLAGKWSALSFVLMQSFFDALSCVLVGKIAAQFDPRLDKLAAVMAGINPTQIVLSGYVYTDSLFLYFAVLSLLGAVRFLTAPSWRDSLLIGAGLGCALATRTLILPWGIFVILFIAGISVWRRRFVFSALAQTATAGLIFALFIAPIAIRNHAQHGSWSLSPQAGMHLSRWVVPLVQEAKDGTPWAVGSEQTERLAVERFGGMSSNPFEQSRRYQTIGAEALRELGVAAILKAWLRGATINLASPAIIQAPPVMQLPRTGFYGTAGETFLGKVANFVFRSGNMLYASILISGFAGLAALRLLQAYGLLEMASRQTNVPACLLVAAWFFYILIVNGPVAAPKYRLPIEPVFVILSAAGIQRFVTRRSESIARH